MALGNLSKKMCINWVAMRLPHTRAARRSNPPPSFSPHAVNEGTSLVCLVPRFLLYKCDFFFCLKYPPSTVLTYSIVLDLLRGTPFWENMYSLSLLRHDSHSVGWVQSLWILAIDPIRCFCTETQRKEGAIKAALPPGAPKNLPCLQRAMTQPSPPGTLSRLRKGLQFLEDSQCQLAAMPEGDLLSTFS